MRGIADAPLSRPVWLGFRGVVGFGFGFVFLGRGFSVRGVVRVETYIIVDALLGLVVAEEEVLNPVGRGGGGGCQGVRGVAGVGRAGVAGAAQVIVVSVKACGCGALVGHKQLAIPLSVGITGRGERLLSRAR